MAVEYGDFGARVVCSLRLIKNEPKFANTVVNGKPIARAFIKLTRTSLALLLSRKSGINGTKLLKSKTKIWKKS